jgi:hypothetical protein
MSPEIVGLKFFVSEAPIVPVESASVSLRLFEVDPVV